MFNWVPVLAQSNAIDGFMSLIMMTVMLAFLALYIVAGWRVFTKAGRPGWLSLIPILNVFVLVDIAGQEWWWVILLMIPIVNIFAAFIILYSLSEKFGYGILFAVGLYFLSPIFVLILAFGGAEYDDGRKRKLKSYV